MSVTNEEHSSKNKIEANVASSWSNCLEIVFQHPKKLSKGAGLFGFFNLQDKADEQHRY